MMMKSQNLVTTLLVDDMHDVSITLQVLIYNRLYIIIQIAEKRKK